jgi:hypothetical protein
MHCEDASEANMRLVVKTWTGKTIAVDVETWDKVDDVKVKIQKQTGIQPERQRIVFAGKKLLAGRRLSDYNVQKNSTVELYCLHGTGADEQKVCNGADGTVPAQTARDLAAAESSPAGGPAMASPVSLSLAIAPVPSRSWDVESLDLNLLANVGFVLQEIVDHLPLRDLIQFGACCDFAHSTATKIADALVESELKGIHLLNKPAVNPLHKMDYHKLPHWAKHRAATQPYCLARGHKVHWPDQTKSVPFVVDSQGPLFLEFQLIAARAPNGTPSVGFVDAESFEKDGGRSHDLSRCHEHRASFAIALNAGSSKVFAKMNAKGPVELHDSGVNPQGATLTPSAGYYHSLLNWPTLGNEDAKWNIPIQSGLFLKDRNLVMYRMNPKSGCWRSSGIICKNLPERLAPCMFMSSFVGYAQMWFVKAWDCPPDVCEGCDKLGHGTQYGWSHFR